MFSKFCGFQKVSGFVNPGKARVSYKTSAVVKSSKTAIFTKYAKMGENLVVFRGNSTTAQASAKAAPSQDMFCFQCEQTRDGIGCTTVGVCGKTPEVAGLQDVLVEACKGISAYMHKAYEMGAKNDRAMDHWVLGALFSTVTNVNFDQDRFIQGFLNEADQMLAKAKLIYKDACLKKGVQPQNIDTITSESLHIPYPSGGKTLLEIIQQTSRPYGVLSHRTDLGSEDLASINELITYGLKGAAAYAHHAGVLGQESDEIYQGFHKVLAFLGSKTPKTANDLLGMALEVGALNFKVMELLDKGSTERYGHPEPTRVRTTAVAGKAIAVSGHDLRDLEEVLKQTEGKGINVYTHGELLPAHGYPGLKKYKHLVGNYGSAWQMQKLEFSTFPGSILMTTNCIIEPRKAYKDRIFTRSVVGYPGVKHVDDYNFSAVIQAALDAPGFAKDETPAYTMTGFARNAVLNAADKIIDLVKNGKINHFFLIGGCDGSEGERNYFKELALNAPKDSVILTLACGKYRFNKFFDKFGDIEGLPRMIDIGQCNDAYSAIQIATSLATAFGTDVNSLPISYSISWFEQKAVAVLLTMLHLGIKNIYLGPKLPAFVTPNVLNILVDKFQLHALGDWKSDMDTILKRK